MFRNLSIYHTLSPYYQVAVNGSDPVPRSKSFLFRSYISLPYHLFVLHPQPYKGSYLCTSSCAYTQTLLCFVSFRREGKRFNSSDLSAQYHETCCASRSGSAARRPTKDQQPHEHAFVTLHFCGSCCLSSLPHSRTHDPHMLLQYCGVKLARSAMRSTLMNRSKGFSRSFRCAAWKILYLPIVKAATAHNLQDRTRDRYLLSSKSIVLRLNEKHVSALHIQCTC